MALTVTTFVILDTAWLYTVSVPGLAPLRVVPSTSIVYLIINATILFIATAHPHQHAHPDPLTFCHPNSGSDPAAVPVCLRTGWDRDRRPTPPDQ